MQTIHGMKVLDSTGGAGSTKTLNVNRTGKFSNQIIDGTSFGPISGDIDYMSS